MDNLIYIFSGIVVLAAAQASITIWSPRAMWVKVGAIGVTSALIVMAYIGFMDLLSKPKPVQMEWVMRGLPEAKVLGSSAREGEAIFVWLQIRGVAEPRAYRVPWDRDLAQQLQDANQDDRGNGTGVHMRRPFMKHARQHVDDQPVFYSPPRQAPARKGGTGSRPMIFGRPG